MANRAVPYAAIAVAVAAVAIAGMGLAGLSQMQDSINALVPQAAEPERREFYLFSTVNPDINEEELGIPPDQFSMSEITVNKGDTVIVHFYNLEPEETEEKHSFTMFEQYQMHHDVDASENKTIEFVASESGVFEYQCVYHVPTMRGQLVVLP